MFEKISRKIGFTVTELKVILFLLSAFLIGFGYKTLIKTYSPKTRKEFDYSKEDSLFSVYGAGYDSVKSNSVTNSSNYKQEVLGLHKNDFSTKPKTRLPEKKSINLNTANIEDLVALPGIGKATAQKIIKFRKKTNGFKNLNQLLQVKGIGNSKLKKIRQYLFIE
jgi:competence ComEA-like helix-hairpin-helix protein